MSRGGKKFAGYVQMGVANFVDSAKVTWQRRFFTERRQIWGMGFVILYEGQSHRAKGGMPP
jgi:hypothetical protein